MSRCLELRQANARNYHQPGHAEWNVAGRGGKGTNGIEINPIYILDQEQVGIRGTAG